MSNSGKWISVVALAGACFLSERPSFAQAGLGGGLGQPGLSDQGKKKDEAGDQLPEIDQKIGNDAQLSFAHAEKAYQNKEWLEAIAYFQHVRAKFSYNLTLATQAQLRLGDIAFNRDKWLEAKEYYKEFVRLHPNHEKVDYAAFQVGYCAYKDIPGEFFLQPPAAERDQSEVRTARNAMAAYLKDHPHSEYVTKAKDIIVTCDNKLAAHEMYVADYYARRGKWTGAAGRAEGLASTYPDATQAPDALILAIKSHGKLKKEAEVRKAAALKAHKEDEAKDAQDDIDRAISSAEKDFVALQALKPKQWFLDRGKAELLAVR
jgi:outer membrane protein assembly factor BamD